MRLIDNDEVVRIVREEVKDEDNTLPVSFRAGVDYVLKIIDELPTIDAIPIEWIKKKLLSCQYEYENDYDKGFDKGWNCVIKTLLKDWEKENE